MKRLRGTVDAASPGGSADRDQSVSVRQALAQILLKILASERLGVVVKARLLMAMAAIDGTHIPILDEPTNHLDIEKWARLVHALNHYQGAVILVNKDPHLVEQWLIRFDRA